MPVFCLHVVMLTMCSCQHDHFAHWICRVGSSAFVHSMAARRLSLAAFVSLTISAMNVHALSSLHRSSMGGGVSGMSGGSNLGDHPIFNMNGNISVDTFTLFMMSKWTLGSAFAPPFWLCSTWKHKHWMMVLFIHLEHPSVWGWYKVDILCWTPMSFINVCQTFDTKILSWISTGHPFLQYHLSKKRNAKSSTVMSEVHTEIWMLAPSLSIMVTIALNPLSLGRGPMKSIAMESNLQSGIGNGWRGPACLVVLALFYRQSGHVSMYPFARSFLILGQ